MLTPDELARLTGRSPELIRRWIRDGRLPATAVGRRYLIAPDAIALVDRQPRVRTTRPTLST
jgi:excisionase family DNA binding protein